MSRLGLAKTITPVRLPQCSPNFVANVERFIQTVQVECLDRFIVMGTSHLDHLVREFMEHYNRERPHSAIGFRTPVGRWPPASGRGPVRCQTRLGGVLRYYYRVAA
ncbi:MAG: integrase core domain-containing protein [Alphaproteobacteria bacterium]